MSGLSACLSHVALSFAPSHPFIQPGNVSVVSKTEIAHDGPPTRASRVDHVPRFPLMLSNFSRKIFSRDPNRPHALHVYLALERKTWRSNLEPGDSN
jgi:hypothetical protein